MGIASQIISNMPYNLSNLEKARYLYLELCKVVNFSTKFHNLDDDVIDSMFSRKVNINTFDENEVNCRLWSQLYSQLLDLVGIKNSIINEGHSYVEFYIDNKKWIADSTYGTYTDLSRVKNDDETIGFGLCVFQNPDNHCNVIMIDEEAIDIIDKIDQKLGYNTDRKQNLLEFKDYLNDIRLGKVDIKSFAHADEITRDNEICFKLEHLFSKIGKLESGYYEQKDFIYHLESILLTDDEMKQIGAVELKRANTDQTVDIVQCIYTKCGNEIKYYLLSPNMMIYEYKKEQIIKLSMMGYGIDDKKIPGIIYPKRFKKGKASSNYGYKMYKNLCNMNIIKLDPMFENLEEANMVR